MINQLATNKEFGHKFDTNEQFWNEIDEIITVLESAYKFTKDMQTVGYGLADFYIGWLRVKKNLGRHLQSSSGLDLAAKLIEHMDRRSGSLFKTPLFLCAVYLDPRMMMTLKVEQKAEAAMNLVEMYKRITDAKNQQSMQQQRMNDTLDEIRNDLVSEQGPCRANTDILLQSLAAYESEAAYNIHEPVMKFWVENSHKYPVLRTFADILHAVPSNQCCTERGFSGLSYIRSKLRMSMKPKNVSNVLMIRLNKDVFYTLRNERVQKILNLN